MAKEAVIRRGKGGGGYSQQATEDIAIPHVIKYYYWYYNY